MLNKLKKQNSEGFTIIEVMIVLVIAGVIILIVLMAIPAMQRNSRNTAIKNDASAVVAAISEFKSNNDGTAPNKTGTLSSGSTVTIDGATGSTASSGKVQGDTKVTGTADAPDSEVPTGTVTVLYGYKCVGSGYSGSSSVTVNGRSVAVIYSVEQSGGAKAGKCIDS